MKNGTLQQKCKKRVAQISNHALIGDNYVTESPLNHRGHHIGGNLYWIWHTFHFMVLMYLQHASNLTIHAHHCTLHVVFKVHGSISISHDLVC